MGIFSSEVNLYCKDCRKYFTAKVGSFLGLGMANIIVNGVPYVVVEKVCPYCGQLKQFVVG